MELDINVTIVKLKVAHFEVAHFGGFTIFQAFFDSPTILLKGFQLTSCTYITTFQDSLVICFCPSLPVFLWKLLFCKILDSLTCSFCFAGRGKDCSFFFLSEASMLLPNGFHFILYPMWEMFWVIYMIRQVSNLLSETYLQLTLSVILL